MYSFLIAFFFLSDRLPILIVALRRQKVNMFLDYFVHFYIYIYIKTEAEEEMGRIR